MEEALQLSAYFNQVIDSEFPQYSLLTESGFRRYLDIRGIYLRTENLEYFEKEGLLLPVIKLHREKSEHPGQKYYGVSTDAYSLKGYKERGNIEFPTIDTYKDWSSYKDGYENTVFMFYHPYQILILQKVLSSVSSIMKIHILEPKEEFNRRFEEIKPFYEQSKKHFMKIKPSWVNKVGLLLRLQNAYQPQYRSIYIPDWRSTEDNYERWYKWKNDVFSPEEILKISILSLKDILNFRDWLAAQARFVDPLKNFYMLFRLMPYRKRMKLTDKALLAQDYYEYGGILNLFLEDVTGEKQPDPDDIFDQRGGSWKKAFYGDPFDYSDSKVQRKIVEDFFSSSMPKMLLLIEGETEAESIPIIAYAMNFFLKNRGVEIYNYEGTGGLKGKNIRGTLDLAKRHGTICFLISDNDELANYYVKDLVREDLLNEDKFVIWDKEYEEDNFSLNEILACINEVLEESGMDGLERGLVEEERMGGKLLMKSLEDAFWIKYHVKMYDIISKRKLGILLGSKRAQQIIEEIKKGEYEPKLNIEKILINISEML